MVRVITLVPPFAIAIAVALVGASVHAQSAWIIRPYSRCSSGTAIAAAATAAVAERSRSPFPPVARWSKFYSREATPRAGLLFLAVPLRYARPSLAFKVCAFLPTFFGVLP